jgi:hypothetical protein
VACFKDVELERLKSISTDDKISLIFDKEEKEALEEEEVDKLILNFLCCEIMDKVMDLGNDYLMNCKVISRRKPSSSSKISTKSGSTSINKCSK